MTRKDDPRENTYMWQELRRLEQDLCQTSQWQLPAISLVVYDTALSGSKAVGLIEDRLIRHGQQVIHIAPDLKGQNTIEEELAHNKSWRETVFFVMHVSFNVDEAIYRTISDLSDFVINNHLRIVFWLTEDDFATYISQMPETWLFEQRFYSLTNTINWESIWSRIGTRTWKTLTRESGLLDLSENTSFEELLSLDIRDDIQGLIKRADLLLNFSLFYFDQKKYRRASIFARKSIELARFLSDETSLIKTSLALLLLQIKSDQKDSPVYLQEINTEKLDRRSSSWTLLGAVYSSLFMLDDAIIAYQKAIDFDRYNPSAFQGLGNTLLQQQQFERAIDSFQQALDIQQNFSSAWYGLGKAYKAVGNYAKALECYQCSAEIDCYQPALWLEISEISDKETSLLAIQRALNLEPETVTFWNALGNIQYGMKNYNDAIRSYYHATSIQKDFGWPYANIALIHAQANQYDKAILLLRKSAQVFQNDFEKAYAYYRLGAAHQQLENYPDAAQAYRQARVLFDNNKFLEHYLLSPGPLRLDASLPKSDEIRTQKHSFSKAIERSLKPKEKMSLAKVLPQKRKISYMKTLKKTLATNQQAHSITYWFELGDFYIRNRMYDLAEDTYRVAIELEPDNGWTYYNLGRAYMFAGLYDDAVPLYEKSIELFTNSKEKALSWNQLANAYRRLNEYPLAVAAYEKARILEPVKNPILARARASILSNCYAQ